MLKFLLQHYIAILVCIALVQVFVIVLKLYPLFIPTLGLDTISWWWLLIPLYVIIFICIILALFMLIFSGPQ